MPTNSIGAGTCNVPVNMPLEERLILGRLACERHISTGELIRRLIDRAIRFEDRTAAGAIRRVRMERRRIKAGVLVALVVLGLFTERDILRPARMLRGRRQETEACV